MENWFKPWFPFKKPHDPMTHHSFSFGIPLILLRVRLSWASFCRKNPGQIHKVVPSFLRCMFTPSTILIISYNHNIIIISPYKIQQPTVNIDPNNLLRPSMAHRASQQGILRCRHSILDLFVRSPVSIILWSCLRWEVSTNGGYPFIAGWFSWKIPI